MLQSVKTTIRWQDEDGNVLGACRTQQIDLPKWGKKAFMRNEIAEFLSMLLDASQKVESNPSKFAGYAFKALNRDSIIQIKSRTNGSYINLRDKEVSRFIKEREL